jgi:hypothetical protein
MPPADLNEDLTHVPGVLFERFTAAERCPLALRRVRAHLRFTANCMPLRSPVEGPPVLLDLFHPSGL